MNLISVIVPVYNSEKTIKDTIKSIEYQTYENLEIIIVNDGSTDNSENICKKLAEEDKRIKYYNIPNGGPSVARNYGLKQMTGKYVAFCDSDDIMNPYMLEELADVINGNKVQLVACNYGKNYKGTQVERHKNPVVFYGEEAAIQCLENDNIGGFLWNKMFYAEVILKNKIMFNEELYYCEDLEFVIRYLTYIDTMMYLDTPLYCYVDNSNNLSSEMISWNKITSLKARLMIYSKLSEQKWKRAQLKCRNIMVRQAVSIGRKLEKSKNCTEKKITEQQYFEAFSIVHRICKIYGIPTIVARGCTRKMIIHIFRYKYGIYLVKVKKNA